MSAKVKYLRMIIDQSKSRKEHINTTIRKCKMSLRLSRNSIQISE